MSQELTNQEKVIQFLNNECKNSGKKIDIYKSDIDNLNINEKEAVQIINSLETDGYLSIKNKSSQDDFHTIWTVILNPSCSNYFNDKAISERENKRNSRREIREWLTLAIALAAFILSIYSIYLQSLS